MVSKLHSTSSIQMKQFNSTRKQVVGEIYAKMSKKFQNFQIHQFWLDRFAVLGPLNFQRSLLLSNIL